MPTPSLSKSALETYTAQCAQRATDLGLQGHDAQFFATRAQQLWDAGKEQLEPMANKYGTEVIMSIQAPDMQALKTAPNGQSLPAWEAIGAFKKGHKVYSNRYITDLSGDKPSEHISMAVFKGKGDSANGTSLTAQSLTQLMDKQKWDERPMQLQAQQSVPKHLRKGPQPENYTCFTREGDEKAISIKQEFYQYFASKYDQFELQANQEGSLVRVLRDGETVGLLATSNPTQIITNVQDIQQIQQGKEAGLQQLLQQQLAQSVQPHTPSTNEAKVAAEAGAAAPEGTESVQMQTDMAAKGLDALDNAMDTVGPAVLAQAAPIPRSIAASHPNISKETYAKMLRERLSEAENEEQTKQIIRIEKIDLDEMKKEADKNLKNMQAALDEINRAPDALMFVLGAIYDEIFGLREQEAEYDEALHKDALLKQLENMDKGLEQQPQQQADQPLTPPRLSAHMPAPPEPNPAQIGPSAFKRNSTLNYLDDLIQSMSEPAPTAAHAPDMEDAPDVPDTLDAPKADSAEPSGPMPSFAAAASVSTAMTIDPVFVANEAKKSFDELEPRHLLIDDKTVDHEWIRKVQEKLAAINEKLKNTMLPERDRIQIKECVDQICKRMDTLTQHAQEYVQYKAMAQEPVKVHVQEQANSLQKTKDREVSKEYSADYTPN